MAPGADRSLGEGAVAPRRQWGDHQGAGEPCQSRTGAAEEMPGAAVRAMRIGGVAPGYRWALEGLDLVTAGWVRIGQIERTLPAAGVAGARLADGAFQSEPFAYAGDLAEGHARSAGAGPPRRARRRAARARLPGRHAAVGGRGPARRRRADLASLLPGIGRGRCAAVLRAAGQQRQDQHRPRPAPFQPRRRPAGATGRAHWTHGSFPETQLTSASRPSAPAVVWQATVRRDAGS